MLATNTPALDMRVFDPQTATEEDWIVANKLMSRLHAEQQPEDPPESLERTKARLLSMPPFVEYKVWVVWNPEHSEMIAYAIVLTFLIEENQHAAQFDMGVLPEWRKRGIGTRLLRLVVDHVAAKNKRLLITASSGAVPAGADFMRDIGARVGLESHENQLDLNDLDHEMVAEWIARGTERNPEFELGLWEGRYPEEQLDEIVKLLETANTAPRGDLEVEDFHWTAEQVRQLDDQMEQEGRERWSMYVRDSTNGELAGFTEVFWRPDRPAVLGQGFTAVWEHYRNRGLGRWLKAAMLDKVLRERPQVRYIRTGNADTNAPMLKINLELGFKPHMTETVWQVETSTVQERLVQRATA